MSSQVIKGLASQEQIKEKKDTTHSKICDILLILQSDLLLLMLNTIYWAPPYTSYKF